MKTTLTAAAEGGSRLAINDLYTFEELANMLKSLGFEGAKRTVPHEAGLNVITTKTG